MRFLRQNTAVKITVGPFIDHADGLTPLDAMTEANLIGVIAYDADDGDAVTVIHFHPAHHDATTDNDMLWLGYAGMWELELTAANTNYTGRMMLCLTDKDQICPVFHEFQVLAVNVYDSLFTGHGPTADLLDVSTVQWTGTAVHATTIAGVPIVQQHTTGGGVDGPTTAYPANFEHLSITDNTGLVATADNQKVDVNTIKTATVAASSTVTFANGTVYTGTPPTVGAIATAVWQDATGTDFNQTNSIGKSLYPTANAVPGGAGGLAIAGSNAATTFANLTVSGTSALGAVTATTIAASGAVTAASLTMSGALQAATIASTGTTTLGALTVTGATTQTGTVTLTNGLAIAGGTNTHAVTLTGASTGAGLLATGGATSGIGISAVGTGTGAGLKATGGATGHGLWALGTGGAGIYALTGTGAAANNWYGIHAVGVGTTESGGLKCVATTDGEGIEGLAAGNGHGLLAVGKGTGEGLHCTGGTGVTGDGAIFESGGNAASAGIRVTGGSGGKGLNLATAELGVVSGTSVTLSGTLQAATIASTGATTLNSLAVTNNASVGGTTTLTGAVTAPAGVTANITGNLSGSIGTVAANGITATSIAADAINAAAIKDGAIDAATFAADVDAEVQSYVNLALVANNLDHLALTATAAADMTTEVADGTVLSRILSATGDTSTYLQGTDSLEALRDRGDLAWATGSGAGADLSYVPSGAPTITTKHADAVGGAYTDLAVVDGALFSIREAATTNPPLDFYFPFAVAAGVFPGTLYIWGYYSGNSTHWMRVQAAVGGVTTVWEDIGTIPNGTDVTAYSFNLTPQHINASTGAAYIRFLHNGVAGVASHYLYLDKLLYTAQSPLPALATAAELAKVPKSDGTATWNDTAKATLQAEATDALNAYDPPTYAEMEARTIASASYATPTNITAASGVALAASQHVIVDSGTVTTLTGHTAQTADVATLITTVGVAGAGLTVLATQASVTTIDDFLDSEVASILAAVDTEVADIKTQTDKLPQGFKLNTQYANFEFPMLDATTKAPKTGVTVTGARTIDGGNWAATTNSATIAEIQTSGFYKTTLAAADLNGVFITFRFVGTGCDDYIFTVKTDA